MAAGEKECDTMEPIAIIGMSFEFAGGIHNADSFWEMLLDGRCAAGPVPPDRFNADSFYHADTNRLDTIPIRRAHFLEGDVSAFDAPFFSITGAEAAAMDPQSRALLEVSYRALENAGIPIEKAAGSRTSVHIGCSSDDYNMIYVKDPEYSIRHAATGKAASMLANKISWFFDLKGPSVRLDTACSASLNALHIACQGLRTGDADMGLVGGANLFLTPESLAPLAHLNFFSPDERCFSFDHRANGYSRGEGYGIIVIKLLSEALKHGDTIRAVIRATGSNENGRTPGGITRVSRAAQETLVRETYKRAGLSLGLTRYVEAHAPGTGGDAVETAALAAVFCEFRSNQDPLYLGSVKANIGHLEGGSGIASLAKAVLMLERGCMPRLANFEHVSPNIDPEKWKLKLPTENALWAPGLRRISVNSFGFGGSNAHVVIDDAYHYLESRKLRGNHSTTPAPPMEGMAPIVAHGAPGQIHLNGDTSVQDTLRDVLSGPMLLVWSAADEDGITRLAEIYKKDFENVSKRDANYLHNLAYTLALRRSHLPWRSFMVAGSILDVQKMELNMAKAIRATNNPQVGFVFTGQGAQIAQMGQELLIYPEFRQSLETSRQHLRSFGCPWDLIEEMKRKYSESNIDRPEFSQPLCTALQIALVDLLRAIGVCPTAVIGHSSGEIAAAYCIGVLSHQTASKIAYFRGLFAGHMANQYSDCGMMAVGSSSASVQEHIDAINHQSSSPVVWIGCFNSPRNVTLTGRTLHLEALQERLDAESIFARKLRLNVAYHSPYMQKIAKDYEAAIGTVETEYSGSGTCNFFSTVTGKKIDPQELQNARYWSRNLTSPVLFAQALANMVSKGSGISGLHALVEVGPHSALRGPMGEILNSLSRRSEVTYIPTLERNTSDLDALLRLQGRLYCLGAKIDFSATGAYGQTPVCVIDLPEYPFNHSRSYWHESRLSKNYRLRPFARSDLLGSRVPDWNPLEARWRNIIRILENPWIQDHKINDVLLYPGAGMLVMAIEAAAQLAQDNDDRPPTGFRLKNVTFPKSLNVTLQPEGVETQIHLRPLKDATDRQAAWSEFRLCLLENGEWADTCRGTILVEYKEPANDVDNGREERERIQICQALHQDAFEACNQAAETNKIYQSLQNYGLDTGPTFHVFDDVHCNKQREATAKILLRQWALRADPEQSQLHIIHPTALDGVFQLGIVALSKGGTEKILTMVPSRIRNLWISSTGLSGPDLSSVLGSAKSAYKGYRETDMSVLVMDSDGVQPRIIVEGLETVIIGNRTSLETSPRRLCYKLSWKPDIDVSDKAAIASYCRTDGNDAGHSQKQIDGVPGSLLPNMGPLMAYLDLLTHKKPNLKILELSGYNNDNRALSGWDILLPKSVVYEHADLNRATDLEAASYDLILLNSGTITQSRTEMIPNHFYKLLSAFGKLVHLNPLETGSDRDSEHWNFSSERVLSNIRLGDSGSADLDLGFEFTIANRSSISQIWSNMQVSVVFEEDSIFQRKMAVNLVSYLKFRGVTDTTMLTTSQINVTELKPETRYICLLELDRAFMSNLSAKEFKDIQRLTAYAKNILWISSAEIKDDPESSIMTGLARTLRTESPDFSFVSLVLRNGPQRISEACEVIAKVLERTVESHPEDRETEYTEGDDSLLYINRLISYEIIDQHIGFSNAVQKLEHRAFGSHPALSLTIANPGLLDSLQFQEDVDASRTLSSDEIEVAPEFCGLNFMDCLVALGRVPQNTLGVECAGRVTRAGRNSDLFPGDRVMLCTDGTIRTRTRCHYKCAIKIPEDLPSAEAGGLPGTAATVYHALCNVARIQNGESILIHAGAGATGQMAIQVAQHVGATIYVTVGSSDKKKLLMQNYGIPESNIFYSRNTSFAEGIRRVTNGRGVDVILNSLAGESLVASWECIASFGRFIEIGKRDVYSHKQLPMFPFAQSTSFSVVDLAAIWRERPEMMRIILNAVMDLVKKGKLHVAQPLRMYSLSQVEDAFRLLQSGKSTGKLVIEMNADDVVPTMLEVKPSYKFHADASYVIAGGLGGLGRSVARWMADRGARNLILLSRSGPRSDAAKALVADLTNKGVCLITPTCDITSMDALSTALEKFTKELPPIKGCIQASMVLKDRYFADMTYAEWTESTEPKVLGSWNLHKLLPRGMDFFILFSSMAGIVGGAGQANYAAGNTYEDGLARYRVSIGEPAVSLDLGMIVSEGVLAENQKLMRALDSTGWYMQMTIEELHALLDRYCNPELGLLGPDDAQVVCGIETPSAIQAKGVREPSWMGSPMFRHVHHLGNAGLDKLKTSAQSIDYSALFAASKSLAEAGAIVSDSLVKKLSHSLSIPTTDIDTSKPLHYYGVDSLVAVELRNWFAKELNADIAIFDILGNRSCEEVGVLAASRSAFKGAEWTKEGSNETATDERLNSF